MPSRIWRALWWERGPASARSPGCGRGPDSARPPGDPARPCPHPAGAVPGTTQTQGLIGRAVPADCQGGRNDMRQLSLVLCLAALVAAGPAAADSLDEIRSGNAAYAEGR